MNKTENFISSYKEIEIISIISLIGGLGLLTSLMLPYYELNAYHENELLQTLTIYGLELDLILLGLIGWAAILAIVSGIDLLRSIRGNPKMNLTLSVILICVAGVLLFSDNVGLDFQNEMSLYIFEVRITINFGFGIIMAIVSSILIVVAFILLKVKDDTLYSLQVYYRKLEGERIVRSRKNNVSYCIPSEVPKHMVSVEQKNLIDKQLGTIQKLKTTVDLDHPKVRVWEDFIERRSLLFEQRKIGSGVYINDLQSYIEFLENFSC